MWRDFAASVGALAGALTGLLFVAVSIKIRRPVLRSQYQIVLLQEGRLVPRSSSQRPAIATIP
jgi:hypothetical protein